MPRDPFRLAHGLAEPEDYPGVWSLLRNQVDNVGQFCSPLKLVQEAVGGADIEDLGWRVILASMMCVRTGRKQSHPAIWRLLCEFPYPERLAMGTPDVARRIEIICRPCGFHRRRTTDLILMSKNYVMGIRPPEIHGAGEYVTNAYKIFVLGDIYCAPKDRELRAFCAWCLRVRRDNRNAEPLKWMDLQPNRTAESLGLWPYTIPAELMSLDDFKYHASTVSGRMSWSQQYQQQPTPIVNPCPNCENSTYEKNGRTWCSNNECYWRSKYRV